MLRLFAYIRSSASFSASTAGVGEGRDLSAAEAETDFLRQASARGQAREIQLQFHSAALRLFFTARDEQQELVAAPAEHVVGVARLAHEIRGDLAQDPVAGGMTERVVDRLEVVDVEEEQRQRRSRSGGAG
jgi:hypothetical protein